MMLLDEFEYRMTNIWL